MSNVIAKGISSTLKTTEKEAIRANIGLGTAAAANVTTSQTDTTAGRLLKVGDYRTSSSSPLVACGSASNSTDIWVKLGTLPSNEYRGTGKIVIYQGVDIGAEGYIEIYFNRGNSTSVSCIAFCLGNFASEAIKLDSSNNLFFKRGGQYDWYRVYSETTSVNNRIIFEPQITNVVGTPSGTDIPIRSFYHTGNILGTVSQSGGVPTGSIIQRGSNANGEFVKFADGTMFATGLQNTLLALAANASATLATPTSPVVFVGHVKRFYTVGLVSLSSEGASSNIAIPCLNGSIRNGNTGFPDEPVIKNIGTASSTSYQLSFLYVGSWY